MIEIDRAQFLAHRFREHQLHRPRVALAKLAVVEAGVQDTPPGSARLALANRLGKAADLPSAGHGDTALVWSMRGSPHVHRRSDLTALAAGLWPLSERDARNRLGDRAKEIVKAGTALLDAFETCADAMSAATKADKSSLTKGELSAAVTERVGSELSPFCQPCGTEHVLESLFRATALAAGLELEQSGDALRFVRIARWRRPRPRPAATTDLLRTAVRVLGPTTRPEAAAFLGIHPPDIADLWPDDLVEVSVEGKRLWANADEVDDLESAERAASVRLLAPGDPYLRGVDRELLVPTVAHRKQLWKAISSPGSLVLDGEVAGTWRAKKAGGRLDVEITPWGRLAKRVSEALDAEAALVAAARGCGSAAWKRSTT